MIIQYVICSPTRKSRERVKKLLPSVHHNRFEHNGVLCDSFILAYVEKVESGETRDALIRRKQLDALLERVRLGDRKFGYVFRFYPKVDSLEDPFKF